MGHAYVVLKIVQTSKSININFGSIFVIVFIIILILIVTIIGASVLDPNMLIDFILSRKLPTCKAPMRIASAGDMVASTCLLYHHTAVRALLAAHLTANHRYNTLPTNKICRPRPCITPCTLPVHVHLDLVAPDTPCIHIIRAPLRWHLFDSAYLGVVLPQNLYTGILPAESAPQVAYIDHTSRLGNAIPTLQAFPTCL